MTGVQRTETTIHYDWKRFQRAFELASTHHFTSFLCVLIPLRDISRCLLIFAQTSCDQTCCFYRTTPQIRAFNVSWEEFLNHYSRQIIPFRVRRAYLFSLLFQFRIIVIALLLPRISISCLLCFFWVVWCCWVIREANPCKLASCMECLLYRPA